MSADASTPRAYPRKWLWLMISAGLAVVLLANAHLVYSAVTSQPECVAHIKRDLSGSGGGKFSAAKSSCTPK